MPQKGVDAKKQTLVVLDPKRSNAINIGLTVLPTVHIIKTAILNFDEYAISKEGIEVSTHSVISIQKVTDSELNPLCKSEYDWSCRKKGGRMLHCTGLI